jgi:hypothetical protein
VIAPLGTEQDLKTQITVYPNPIDDYVTIEGDNIRSVKIYSMGGSLLLDLNQIDRKINLSKLIPGIYMIEIRTEKETLMQRLYKN